MSTMLPLQLPPKCHEGNNPILSIEGGTLWAGGWGRGAWPYPGDAVIDLTGTETSPRIIEALHGESAWRNTLNATKDIRYGPWLSLPMPDLGVPNLNAEFWHSLKLDITELLRSGTDLLVACAGGHGRTGVAVSILAHLFGCTTGCPITWLRNRYCEEAVETEEQVYYVYEMLGLGEPPKDIMPTPYLGGTWCYYNGHLVQEVTNDH